MGVLEIEREAREAGLLGPDAVIGQSVPFAMRFSTEA